MRFNELRPGLDRRHFAAHADADAARPVERDGLITRTVFPTIPPRVDYALTALGRDLLESGLGARGLGDPQPAEDRAAPASNSTRFAQASGKPPLNPAGRGACVRAAAQEP